MKTFIKKNLSSHSDSLHVEYKGLLQLQKLLQDIDEIKIPAIDKAESNILELEFIEQSNPTKKQMREFGTALAKMHKNRFELYGLSYDNYIGLNPQKNCITSNWGEFFINNRLIFQIELIAENQLQMEFFSIVQKHYEKIKNFLNSTTNHPSLVHGDLWSGNVLFSKSGVYLIDPAIYFADREVDIAMSEMFGGFSKDFYESYNEAYPLTKEYPIKKDIYNLYHYLNHYNLFGNAYLDDCIQIIEQLEKL